MEETIQVIIYIHAVLGTLGLLTGLGSILFRKGGIAHKRSGIVFVVCMGLSALFSIIVARLPGHRNTFLFCIGIFTIYMIISGYHALRFKGRKEKRAGVFSFLVSGSMLLVSAWMLGQGLLILVEGGETGILYIVFGAIGLLLSLGDFKFYNRRDRRKMGWLTSHIGRMCGALIAAITAFMVAGLHLNSLFYWIAPTVLGTFYIRFWIRKVTSAKGRAIGN